MALDQYSWIISTALGQNQGYMGDVHISLTTMDVHIMMMWEFIVNQVYDALNNIATEIITTNIIFMLQIVGLQLLKHFFI